MSTRFITLTGFALIIAAATGLAVISTRRPSLITLPALLARVTESRACRLLLALVWAWLGWHLFARGSGAFE
jgi:hypothetical protein